MINTLLKRIRKLETILQSRDRPTPIFLYGYVQHLPGYVQPLPKEALGNRHLVAMRREPTALPNVELCQFEEQIGPPPACSHIGFTVYLSSTEETDS
jgi:hypothetical protein